MSDLQKIIKVTQSQYEILANGGTVGGYTGLNSNYIYLVENNDTFATEEYVGNAIMNLTDDLAEVATSGSYNDLTDLPPIPTVGNGTLTIKQNGTQVGTFTANQGSNTTVELVDTWPTLAELGLDSALRYHGITTTALSDGATTNPIIIDGKSHTAEVGCVVFSDHKEFVWNGSKWELLGDEGSYKVKQTAVVSPSANGNATAFIDTISQDANGVITATKKNVTLPTFTYNSTTKTLTIS